MTQVQLNGQDTVDGRRQKDSRLACHVNRNQSWLTSPSRGLTALHLSKHLVWLLVGRLQFSTQRTIAGQKYIISPIDQNAM